MADRQAHQAGRDAAFLLFLIRQAVVSGGGGVGDGALAVAQISGDGEQFGVVDEPPGRVLPAVDDEADDAAEVLLLALRQFMLRVVGQPRIIDLGDARPAVQPIGNLRGAAAVGSHAQAQGFQPLEEHPGVERAHGRAAVLENVVHVLAQQFFPAQHCAADTTPLTVQVLGGRMNDYVGAEQQRLLQGRCAEAVIHHQQAAAAPGQVRQTLDVGDFRQRIGRGFQV